jgi:YVTN family beta-propeller protein
MKATTKRVKKTKLPWRVALALTLTGAIAVPANAASFNPLTGELIFTNDADWGMGTFTNLNYNSNPPDTNNRPPGNNQLQLNPALVTQFNNIWVALSGRGTAVRIDTDHTDPDGVVSLADSAAGNGAVLGEYYTAPNGMGRDPSRTTVDLDGNVWVTNRAEASGGRGSVVKISANPGTGATTSSGIWNGSTFNVLPWTNAGSADTNGGTSTAVDDALLLYIRTTGTNARTVAIDANNDVWVGGLGNRAHQLYDGDTGAPIASGTPTPKNSFNVGAGGYGGLVDGNGVLWSASGSTNLVRHDPATGVTQVLGTQGRVSYGLGVDSNGKIWMSNWTNNSIQRINGITGAVELTINTPSTCNRGVAVTPDNNIWVAGSCSNTVTRLANNGTVLASIPVGAQPTGLSVDSNGKVWVTNLDSNSTMRINPATNSVELRVDLGPGASPYNYSDMTGSVSGGVTNPSGFWRSVTDSGITGQEWLRIFWNTEAAAYLPPGAEIILEARASDDPTALISLPYTTYNSGDALSFFGRYLDVKATLKRDGTVGSESPVLSNIRSNSHFENKRR